MVMQYPLFCGTAPQGRMILMVKQGHEPFFVVDH